MLLILQILTTLFMTGLIWFVQVVHYPLFDQVGTSGFAIYEQRHSLLTTWVVLPPMTLELVTAGLLLWYRPSFIPGWSLYLGLSLVLLIWASTFFLQVPQHGILAQGFDPQAHFRLVTSNWLRTVLWSMRSLLVCFWLWRLLQGASRNLPAVL